MPISISYSCASTFQECEYKGCLKYFLKAPKDKDYVEPDYFKIGNAFHKVLELTNHDPSAFPGINFDSIVKSYSLDPFEDGGKIMAMLRQYWAFHVHVPLSVVGCEYKFVAGNTNGIIDTTMQEKGDCSDYNLTGIPGAWWIVDLKSASRADEALPSRLHRDPQMCLYASVADIVAAHYRLDPKKFAGIRYREVTKPGQIFKLGETFQQWTTRCLCSFREIVIPKDEMDLAESKSNFGSVIGRIRQIENALTTGDVIGLKNPKACLSWGRSCEYFSQCNGGTYTEKLTNARVTRLEASKPVGNKKIKQDIESLENLMEEFR